MVLSQVFCSMEVQKSVLKERKIGQELLQMYRNLKLQPIFVQEIIITGTTF